ncbi:phosphoribosylformylglycinamidine synthase I, partial [Methanosalsum natronophilum]
NEGKPVLGICNGFQILTEASLLDGALMTNSYPKFICDWTYLKVENNNTIFTSRFNEGEVIKIPVAHKEGNYYNTPERLNELNNNHQVAFRYVNQKGHLTNESNPNGSVENIAGITNSKGNVLGLMPHPERAAESILGSKDGLKLFLSMVDYFSNE